MKKSGPIFLEPHSCPRPGPGLKHTFCLATSLRATPCGDLPPGPEDSSSFNCQNNSLPCTGLGVGNTGRRREGGLEVKQASQWWEGCKSSQNASEKVIFCVNQKHPLHARCVLCSGGKSLSEGADLLSTEMAGFQALNTSSTTYSCGSETDRLTSLCLCFTDFDRG